MQKFVVDTCVARSAGNSEATDSTSLKCMMIISAIFENAHSLLFNCQLYKEWLGHGSKYAINVLEQLVSMSRVSGISKGVDTELIRKAREILNDPKDAHLLSLAKNNGGKIVSRDSAARRKYALALEDFLELQFVVWVDVQEDPDIPHWIEQEAPENGRTLRDYERKMRQRNYGTTKAGSRQ